ncbi:MAG: ester cyclase [Candidatus Latescibacteria bacterium]|jgi:predicted ester cyclase|nr:ester cyclase [Candidatus Latescibacterota bacterium]
MKDTKEIVRDYFYRLLNEKDLSVCNEILAPGYIDHDAPENTPPDPESTRKYVANLLNDYPDLKIQIEDILSENNKVAVRLTWHGTHKDSGDILHHWGIVILHLSERGQIVERWSTYE